MKIEKVNENQIRCMLTREDLEARQIKLAELAYGSEKAKKLFHEMVKQAAEELDFHVEDIPLMVEAIPGSADSLVLLISKVEYFDELDPRFSRFSDPGEEYFEQDNAEGKVTENKKSASEIVEKFRKKEEKVKDPEMQKKELVEDADLITIFEFDEIELAMELARYLKGFYKGRNSLYKNELKKNYFVVMHKDHHSPLEFNKICNMAAEFGDEKTYVPSMEAYYREHSKLVMAPKALQMLSLL